MRSAPSPDPCRRFARVAWVLTLCAACAPDRGLDGVIVVSLDTLRADRLGAYGSTRGLTPALDRFAAESVVFDRAYAQANETLYSHASLFTARYPSEIDVLDGAFRLPAATPTLASVFADAGWSTAAVVAGGHLSAAFGLGLGFDSYDDATSWGSLRDTGSRALRWLDQRDDRPFFLFVHGYDTHDRYLKPPPFGYLHADPAYGGVAGALIRAPGATSAVVHGHATSSPDAVGDLALLHPRFGAEPVTGVEPDAPPLTDADVAQVSGAYDGAVAWADASFGVFIAGLDARGLLDRTAVVVLSDHGEELGESGSFNHRFTLSDAAVHVPLMVRLPGGRGGGTHVTGLTELVDVAPTLWGLAGVQAPAGVRGQARLDGDAHASGERRVAYSEGGLRLLSARDDAGRLTACGLSAENPMAADLLEVAPVDGVSLRYTGAGEPAATLRAALVERLRDPALVRRVRR